MFSQKCLRHDVAFNAMHSIDFIIFSKHKRFYCRLYEDNSAKRRFAYVLALPSDLRYLVAYGFIRDESLSLFITWRRQAVFIMRRIYLALRLNLL
jgi:hypothetical protein